jgi:hypothetical protein
MLVGDGDTENHHFEAVFLITFDTELEPVSKKKI